MFYSIQLLGKGSPLAKLWVAAHAEKRLKKQDIYDTSVSKSVEDILTSENSLALRLSGLLLLGVVRIYIRKLQYLRDDCSNVASSLHQAGGKQAAAKGTPASKKEAMVSDPATITLPAHLDVSALLPLSSLSAHVGFGLFDDSRNTSSFELQVEANESFQDIDISMLGNHMDLDKEEDEEGLEEEPADPEQLRDAAHDAGGPPAVADFTQDLPPLLSPFLFKSRSSLKSKASSISCDDAGRPPTDAPDNAAAAAPGEQAPAEHDAPPDPTTDAAPSDPDHAPEAHGAGSPAPPDAQGSPEAPPCDADVAHEDPVAPDGGPEQPEADQGAGELAGGPDEPPGAQDDPQATPGGAANADSGADAEGREDGAAAQPPDATAAPAGTPPLAAAPAAPPATDTPATTGRGKKRTLAAAAAVAVKMDANQDAVKLNQSEIRALLSNRSLLYEHLPPLPTASSAQGGHGAPMDLDSVPLDEFLQAPVLRAAPHLDTRMRRLLTDLATCRPLSGAAVRGDTRELAEADGGARHAGLKASTGAGEEESPEQLRRRSEASGGAAGTLPLEPLRSRRSGTEGALSRDSEELQEDAQGLEEREDEVERAAAGAGEVDGTGMAEGGGAHGPEDGPVPSPESPEHGDAAAEQDVGAFQDTFHEQQVGGEGEHEAAVQEDPGVFGAPAVNESAGHAGVGGSQSELNDQGLSAHTVAMLDRMDALLQKNGGRKRGRVGSGACSLTDLMLSNSRSEAARSFYNALVLQAKGMVRIAPQKDVYDDLELQRIQPC